MAASKPPPRMVLHPDPDGPRPSGRPAILSRAGLHTGAVFFGTFAAMGVHLPFWPLWLEERGLSASQIGLYAAAGMAARVLAGVGLPALADRLDARRAVMMWIGIAGALAAVAHPFAPDGAALLVLTMLVSAAFSGLIPLGDALGAAAAKAHGFEYGQARSAGSLAFLLVSLAMGAAVAALGIGVAVPVIAVFLLMTAAFGFTHPGGGKVKARRRPGLADFRGLIAARPFLLFVGAIGFAQSSHAVYYAYSSVRWRALGLSDGEIGALWAFGVGVEVALMLIWGGALLRRFGPAGAIALSAAAGVIRWTIMAFDPLGPSLWALQTLHAISFAAGHLGAIGFIQAAVGDRLAAAAQGLYGAAGQGLLVAGAMALSAAIYPWAGGGTYFLAAAMSLIGCAFALWLRSSWDGRSVTG